MTFNLAHAEEARRRLIRRKKTAEAMDAAFENDLEKFIAIEQSAKEEGAYLSMNAKYGEDSFIGEAACGNALEMMRYLINTHAVEVNCVGQHNRTPLHRATYNDAAEAVQLLLDSGADPRLLLPQKREEPSPGFPHGKIEEFREWDPLELSHSSFAPKAKEVIMNWDINRTFALMAKEEERRATLREAEELSRKTSMQRGISDIAELQEQVREKKAELQRLTVTRERRIVEYDTARCEGKTEDQLSLLDGLIKEAAAACLSASSQLSELEKRLQRRKIDVQQARRELESDGHSLDDSPAQAIARFPFDRRLRLDELEATFLHDADEEMLTCGKAPLAVDTTGNALTFLLYRGVSVLTLAAKRDMMPDRLLLSLLGAIRFGKKMLFDFRDHEFNEQYVTLKERFDAVSPGLFSKIVNRKVIERSVYKELVTEEALAADPSLEPAQLNPGLTRHFALIVASTAPPLADTPVMDIFFTVCVEE